MRFLKKFPTTLLLVLVNVIVFTLCYLTVRSFADPAWTLHLLKWGAEFNPLTLDKEWYRILTHMFLHANVLHLLLNMYALFAVGSELEQEVGTRKFLWIYFLSGIAASLNSLYWGLFIVGVGASGAIFGLFGAALVINLYQSRQQGRSVVPILTNFIIFIGINLIFANAFHADNAAHLGGLATGIAIGALSMLMGSFRSVKVEYILLPVLVLIYFFLPRYQVSYFQFFQKVLAVEDSTQSMFERNLSDKDFIEGVKKNNAAWDKAAAMLNAHPYLPAALHGDTMKLKHYVALRKKEGAFRITMIERESFVYLDSIGDVGELMKPLLVLDYPLTLLHPVPRKTDAPQKKDPEMIKVWYNGEWEEIPGPPGAYYRIGARDSLGQWQGNVIDYYDNGDVQMKGTYRDGERNGIFIYYSDHNTHASAGRYKADEPLGKWETFHYNGRLKSEEYYTNRYFLKSLWDSAGEQQVREGYGKEIKRGRTGVITMEGDYSDGNKNGYWYGRRPNGEMYFEEYYNHGHLVNGRSRNLTGQNFVYDASSLFPLPAGGYIKLKKDLQQEIKRLNPTIRGTLRLSFRVTQSGKLTDFKMEKSISKASDEEVKQLLLKSHWLPARDHGHLPTTGYAVVQLEF